MVTQNKEMKNGIWKKKCPGMIKPTNRTDIYIESTRLIEWCREYMFGIY